MNRHECDKFLKGIVDSGLADCMSAAIEKSGKTVYEFSATNGRRPEYAGFAADTRFNIGSVSKIITSAMLVMLIERGKLSAADKVRKYIPEYPFDDVAIEHLLLHTSGCTASKPSTEGGQKAYLERIFAITERSYEIGTALSYWTAGYSVVMELIQRVTGEPFEQFAKREIFERLGMGQSSFLFSEVPAGRHVFPLSQNGDRLLDLSKLPVTGDSNLYTTPQDLLKLSRSLLDVFFERKQGILSKYGVDLMFREATNGRFDRTLAFWRKSQKRAFSRCAGDLNSEEALYHTGYTGCMLLLDPAYDLSVAILSNSLKLHSEDANYSRIINAMICVE